MRSSTKTSLLLSLLITSNVACSGGEDPAADTPAQGSERGECYPNMTCDEGLMCASGLCVERIDAREDMSSEGKEDMSSLPSLDMSSLADLGEDEADMSGIEPDASGSMPDMSASRERITEMEPNDGAMFGEVNQLGLEQVAVGAIDVPGDADVWRLDVPPGQILTVTLSAPAGSELAEHLTVIDTGRNDKAASEDYVKIAHRTEVSGASLTMVTMGEGGYFLIARDARNVGVNTPEQGSAAHTYELSVEARTLEEVTANQDVLGAGRIMDALDEPGDIDVYPFTTTTEGAELRADLRASAPSMDARLIVYSAQTRSWIARQDNRTAGNDDPLLDAPLFASGPMWLIVENVTPESTDLDYTLTVSLTEL